MSLKAFVTGASGFVGMNLIRQLVRQGWETTAMVRTNSPLEDIEGLGVNLVEGDITDAGSVLRALPVDVDCVFHIAASTNIWSRNNEIQTLVNVDGTRNVVEAALSKGAGRFVHTSSFVVWGFVDGLLKEDTPRVENADWINYVRTKFEAERIVQDAVSKENLDAVILNPSHILGPGDRRNWSKMIRLVNENNLPGVPPGGGSFSDVREVAKAHIQAFHKGRKGHNYLLGGPDTLFLDVVALTGDILGKKVPDRESPAWLLKAIGQLYALVAEINNKEPDLTPESAAMVTRHITCDSSKAMKELDYRYTPVRKLLTNMVDWMRYKGLLS